MKQGVTVDRSVTEKSLSSVAKVSRQDFYHQAGPEQVDDSTQLRVDTNIMNRNPLGRKNKKTQIGSMGNGKKQLVEESMSLEIINSKLAGVNPITNKLDSSYKKPILIKKKEKIFHPNSYSRGSNQDEQAFDKQNEKEEKVVITDLNRKEKIRNSVKFSEDQTETDTDEVIFKEKNITPKHRISQLEEENRRKSRARSTVKQPDSTQTEYFTETKDKRLHESVAKYTDDKGNEIKFSKVEANKKTKAHPTNQTAKSRWKAAEMAAVAVINMNDMTRGRKVEQPNKIVPTFVLRKSPKKQHKKITYDDDDDPNMQQSSTDDSSESTTEDDFKKDQFQNYKNRLVRSLRKKKSRKSSRLRPDPFMEVESESFVGINENFRRQSEVSHRPSQDFETDYNIFYDTEVRLDLKFCYFFWLVGLNFYYFEAQQATFSNDVRY